jgi:geranylgeranyl diphosphate synthase type I
MGKLEDTSLPDAFRRYGAELETELVSAIGGDPLHFYTIMRYHMGWVDEQGSPREASRGKHLRPTLCLLVCEMVGGDWHQALPGAAAVEIVHNFTLVHDDVQDKSSHRRHRPTVWNLWGIPQAINVGDGMWAAAQLEVLRLQEKGVAPDKVIIASRLLADACLKLCEGQYLDVSFESRPDIDIDDYLRMIDGKTAQLFSCSLALGAIVGTEDEQLISQLGVFGRELGLAFQIQDDLLGIWGDEEATGKSAHTDVKEKKMTLPIICALKEADGEKKQRLTGLYQSERTELTAAQVAEVVEILDAVGARVRTEEFKRQYHAQALEELDRMELSSQSSAELRAMATYVLSQF